MFGDTFALALLVKVDAVDALAGNINCAGVHYDIVPEQHVDQHVKVGWLEESALQLTISSRPVSADPVYLAARSTDLLVRNGQRANDPPAGGRDERPSFINKKMHS